jgi:hypothetical protein
LERELASTVYKKAEGEIDTDFVVFEKQASDIKSPERLFSAAFCFVLLFWNRGPRTCILKCSAVWVQHCASKRENNRLWGSKGNKWLASERLEVCEGTLP